MRSYCPEERSRKDVAVRHSSWIFIFGQHSVNIWSCCGGSFDIISCQKPFFSGHSKLCNPKSLSNKTQKSYFCLSFLLISNSFFTALFVTSLRSQVDGQCLYLQRSIFMGLYGPGIEILERSLAMTEDFHQLSAPSLSSRRPLI